MRIGKKFIFMLLIIGIFSLFGCGDKVKETGSSKQGKDNSSANESKSSYQYVEEEGLYKWIPEESGNYVTDTGIEMTEEELSSLRMYLSDETISSMPLDVYNSQYKGYKGHGGFSYKNNLITDNFIYVEAEKSSLERDDIVNRAKEELSNAAFPSDGFKYADLVKADYDEKEDVWRITYTDTTGHKYGKYQQYIAYMTGTGKTMYLIYTTTQS